MGAYVILGNGVSYPVHVALVSLVTKNLVIEFIRMNEDAVSEALNSANALQRILYHNGTTEASYVGYTNVISIALSDIGVVAELAQGEASE